MRRLSFSTMLVATFLVVGATTGARAAVSSASQDLDHTKAAPLGTFELIAGPWSGPRVETLPSQINDRGDIVGTYDEGYLTQPHLFVKLHDCRSGDTARRCGKAFTLDAPGAEQGYRGGTYGVSIDHRQTVLGWYPMSFIGHGALWGRVCDRWDCTWIFQSFEAPGAATIPTFPATGTFARAMGENGTIAGDYFDENQRIHGYVAIPLHHKDDDSEEDRSGPIPLKFSEIVVPGQTTVYAFAVSSNGIVAGEACGTSCEAYVRSPDGEITVFGNVQSGNIQPVSVNSSGTVVGTIYYPTTPSQGFLRTWDGKLIPLPFEPASINDDGIIVFETQSGVGLRFPDGSVKTFRIPAPWGAPRIQNLNNRGWITGYVQDSNDRFQGFVWRLY